MEESSIVSRIAHEFSAQSTRLLPLQSWWDQLDRDFASSPQSFKLALPDRIQVGAAAGFDHVLRTALAMTVTGTAIPLGYHPRELRSSMKDLAFYAAMAESRDPTRFFKEPPSGVRVRVKEGRWFPRFQPRDGLCEEIAFDSPFQPVNPRLHSSYLRHRSNRVAHAKWLRHRDGPRPTIVAIHGFTADWYLINEWFFALPWFYRMGCDVVLFTLPFHGSRQTRFSHFSGHGCLAGGPCRLNEAIAQAVFDFRILLRWLLEERGAEQVGVTGVSLGGFTSAMLASVEDRLAFAIPNVPIVSFADVVLEWQPIGWLLRAALLAMGGELADARRLTAVSSPLTYRPVVPRERLMIVGGVGDRLAPPKHSHLLWEHWDRCRIHWFPGSHLIHLDRGDYLVEMARFMSEIGFLPSQSLPEKQLE